MKALALILAAVAAGAPAGEAQPPRLSEPLPVAPDCVRDGALLQAAPAAAFGKRVYLVAWSDGSRMLGAETADIYCARLDPATGRSLDPKGVAVCQAANLQGRPAVAFDGHNFLVVWQDLRNGQDYDLYAARVGEDGKVLDADGFPVVRRADNQAWPAVAFADGHYVVAWMDARQYPVYGLYFARVTPAGKVADEGGRPLDVEDPARIAKAKPAGETWLGDKYYWWEHLASRTAPAAASNGRDVLVVYMREYPFAGSGRPALTAGIVRAGAAVTAPVKAAGGPSPAWAGGGWVLGGPVWKGGWTPTPLLGAGRLDPNGQPAADQPAALDVVGAFGGGYNVGKGSTASFPSAAAFNGRSALVAMQYAWRKGRSDRTPVFAILLVRLSTSGPPRVLDANPLLVASAESPACVNSPALAAGPAGQCLLVYQHDAAIDTCRILWRLITEGP